MLSYGFHHDELSGYVFFNDFHHFLSSTSGRASSVNWLSISSIVVELYWLLALPEVTPV